MSQKPPTPHHRPDDPARGAADPWGRDRNRRASPGAALVRRQLKDPRRLLRNLVIGEVIDRRTSG